MSFSAPSSAMGKWMPRPRNRKSEARKNFLRQLFVDGVVREHRLELGRDAQELLRQAPAGLLVERPAHAPQVQGQQEQRGQLRGEGLGGSHADLRPGVRVDRARPPRASPWSRARCRWPASWSPSAWPRAARPACRPSRPIARSPPSDVRARGWDRDSGTRCRSPPPPGMRASFSIMNLPASAACQLVPQAMIFTCRNSPELLAA